MTMSVILKLAFCVALVHFLVRGQRGRHFLEIFERPHRHSAITKPIAVTCAVVFLLGLCALGVFGGINNDVDFYLILAFLGGAVGLFAASVYVLTVTNTP